jgi:nucleoid-associated protein YgaU
VTGAADRSYEVVPGDTLGAIAMRHYGNASRHKVIADANPGSIADPDLIYPGQVLQLPRIQ